MKHFSEYKNQKPGMVSEVKFPLVKIRGLTNAFLNEVVVFEGDTLGEIYSLDGDSADVLVFDKDAVDVGSRAVLSGEVLSVGVGKHLLGQVIDPLGNPLDKNKKLKNANVQYPLEVRPPGIGKRAKISRPFFTGVSMVDLLIPLGIGQRELVLGDRKIGRTSFLFSVVKTQLSQNDNPPVVVWAAIGKRKSEIKAMEEFFEKEGLLSRIIMVGTSSFDPPSLIYLTPYSAMSIAEYFRDNGKDVLVVLDDLSTHARFYREIALLARRFPGRDSYPGDIFYTHARLLERAGNFKHGDNSEVAITCLPVAETIEGDLTGYITTNLMGVTDGHIFFDSNLFYKGRRPAINIPLSVTRVGKQTQDKLRQSAAADLSNFLIRYQTSQDLSHFGAELTEETKQNLVLGEEIVKFFDQSMDFILADKIQLILLSLIWLGVLREDDKLSISSCKANLSKNFAHHYVQKLFDDITNTDGFDSLLDNVAKEKKELLKLCQ